MENLKENELEPELPKIKVFQVTQEYLAIAGITSNLSIHPYRFSTRILQSFSIICTAMTFATVFVFYGANSFAEYTKSAYACAFVAFMFYSFLTMVFGVDNWFRLIDSFECVANTTLKCNPGCGSIFRQANEFNEKLNELIFFVMVKLTPVCVYLPWCIYFYTIYFTGSGNDVFELPFPLWFPFDWKNPFGFLIANAIEFVMFSCMILLGACLLSLFCGACIHFIGMTKCMKGSLFHIARCTDGKADQSHLMEQFIEFVTFQTSVKQVISDVSKIFEDIITFLFVWSLITISGAFLMIHMELSVRSYNLAVMVVVIVQAFYAFGVLLLCCENGQRISLAYEGCTDVIAQFEWYLFPIEIQRMLPFIIHFAQQPAEIKCVGSAKCNRDTFKCVINRAFSYFTVLRKFYK